MLTIEKQRGDDGVLCLRLSGNAAIHNAEQLRQALLTTVREEPGFRVNLAGVTQMDLTCLQLLCSTHRTVAGTGQSVVLDNEIPDELLEIISCSGYSRQSGGAHSPEPSTCLWIREPDKC